MQLETTIQQMFDAYPSLYANREECYDHLFCVIGNGYDWLHGQLVPSGDAYSDDSNVGFRHDADYARVVPRAVQSEENIRKKRNDDRNMWNTLRWFRLQNKGEDIGEYSEATAWYPISERYSYVLNFPENIKPDWKIAIEECKAMLIRDGVLNKDGSVNRNYHPRGAFEE
jgi:hypothetical protein